MPFSICDENEVLVLGKPGNRGKSGGLVLFLKIPFSAHVPPKTSNLLYSKVFLPNSTMVAIEETFMAPVAKYQLIFIKESF